MALRSRRAADGFAAALEHPDAPMSAENQRLAQLVRELQAAEQPTMSPAFAAEVRHRLLREFPDVVPARDPPARGRAHLRPDRDRTQPAHPRRHGQRLDRPNLGRPDPSDPKPDRTVRPTRRIRRPALASIGAVAAVVIGTATAVGAISQQALPGDALYPVKRGVEQVEVGIARGDHSKGEHLLAQAGTRLAEVRALSITRGDGAGTSQLVDDTLHTFRDQASQGSTSLVSDYRAHHDTTSIRDVRGFAATSVAQLTTIVNHLAPSTGRSVLRTVHTLQAIDDAASTVCPSCSARPALRIPPPLKAALSLAGASRPGAVSPGNGPAAKAQRPGGRSHPGGRSSTSPTSPRLSPGPGGGTEPSGGAGHPLPGSRPGRSLPTTGPSLPPPTRPVPSQTLPVPPATVPPPHLPGGPASTGGGRTRGVHLPSSPVQLP